MDAFPWLVNPDGQVVAVNHVIHRRPRRVEAEGDPADLRKLSRNTVFGNSPLECGAHVLRRQARQGEAIVEGKSILDIELPNLALQFADARISPGRQSMPPVMV